MFIFYFYLFVFTISERKCLHLVFWENDVLAFMYFVKICGLYVSKIWIYPWISTENLWIWIWMGNFISTASMVINRPINSTLFHSNNLACSISHFN